MSNEHHYLPILLISNHGQDQTQACLDFLKTEKNWQQIDSTSPQLTWINQDNKTISIDNVRQLITDLAFASHQGKDRCYILLNWEKASLPAQHALLKSLEEPPAQTQIILVTTQPNSVLPTIRSRCVIRYAVDDREDQLLPEASNQEKKSQIELLNFCLGQRQLTHSQLIQLCEDYKDREAAISLINFLVIKVHEQKNEANNAAKVLKQLLTTLQQLEQNANVKLALEAGLFAIKNV